MSRRVMYCTYLHKPHTSMHSYFILIPKIDIDFLVHGLFLSVAYVLRSSNTSYFVLRSPFIKTQLLCTVN